MKICILGPSLSAVSGVSTHLNQLLSSELAEQYEFIHFQVGSQGRNESTLDKFGRLLLGPLIFFSFLLRHDPHVVHLNTSLDQKSYWRDLAFMLVARLLQKKIVFQKHGGPLPEHFFESSRALTALFRLALSMPNAIVVLGHEEFDAYQRFVPGQKIVEIPNAIDPGALLRRPLDDEPAGPLHLAYLGRIAENKGIFEAVEALARLVRNGRDMRLTFAGGGPDEARLKERVRSLGLEGRIRFAGPLFGAEKDALWASAHVFVFPTYREGLPYALLEAMAAGAVPVTTRVGAIPDVMKDGEHGLFVSPKDVDSLVQALARLDDDRALLLRLAQAGRARVLQRYTINQLSAEFAPLYASLSDKQKVPG